MERLSGIASKVRHSTSVSGGGDQPVDTTHIALFYLGARPVQAKAGQPHRIDDGDQVVAVGASSGGVFRAFAYANLSNGVSANQGWMMRLLVGTALLLFGVFVGFGPAIGRAGAVQMAIAVAFSAFSLALIFSGVRTLQAVMQLDAGTAAR